MRLKRTSYWLALCLALPLPALAFDISKTKSSVAARSRACESGYETSGRGADYYSTGCEQERYEIWDQALGRVYSELIKALPAPCRSLLRKSQRAWLTYRDTDTAAFMASVEVRPGNSYFDAIRKTQRVQDRVELLASLLDDVKYEPHLCPSPDGDRGTAKTAPSETNPSGR